MKAVGCTVPVVMVYSISGLVRSGLRQCTKSYDARYIPTTPRSYCSFGGSYRQTVVVDVTVIKVIFPGGHKAYVLASWLYPYEEQRLVAAGNRKIAVLMIRYPKASRPLLIKGKLGLPLVLRCWHL